MLRDSSMEKFVCDECYQTQDAEYPQAGRLVEVDRAQLAALMPQAGRLGFHAGYLIGSREDAGQSWRIHVSTILDSTGDGRGTVLFFGPGDIMKIRRAVHDSGRRLVGLFRTSPSGSPDFNDLDRKTVSDMTADLVYLVIGGDKEMKIAALDKHSVEGEIGVLIS